MHHDKSIRDVMTPNPKTVEPGTSIKDAAKLIKTEEIGALPVVEGGRLTGMITDRDIVIRAVAENKLDATVGDIASKDVVSIDPEQSLEEAARLMAEHQIRRLPVVDAEGCCVGIIAQADLAWTGREHDVAELVREVSRDPGMDRVL
jgi:CBS domain-containing protein